MKKSRTMYAIKNSISGVISKLGVLILEFLCRTIFIRTLGTEYLGLNGLFTNILTILSFAELGLGSAIIYNMYKPIAYHDNIQISKLLKLYKKCYNFIMLFIFLGGVICIPFLNSITGTTPDIKENIIIIYMLFLIQSITSYFLTYRRSLISADQKEYMCSNADLISEFIATVFKLCILLFLKNYILFLLAQISRNIVANLILYVKSKKLYLDIDENNVEDLSKEETKDIFKNVKSLILYKVSSTINTGTDNIIIAKMINLATVGIVSNYSTLISAGNQILHRIMLSFTAGIGNLNAKDSIENKEKVFYSLNFVVTLIYGFCGIMLIIFINPFVKLWLGEEFLLDLPVILALGLEFYVCGIQYVGYNYAITTGLFKKAKWGALISSVINIFLSILLGKKFGLFGIFIATGLSRICAQTWLDPYFVFKYEFKKSSKPFFIKTLRNFLIVLINLIISYLIISKIQITNILLLIICVILATIISVLIFIVLFYNTWEFKDFVERLKFLFIKKRNNYK